MSKLVFIPDIHGRIKTVNHVLTSESDADLFIHSNDCFDWFHDDANFNGQVAKWLKPLLHDPKHVWLMSNHVQSYTWPHNEHMMCSGFTREKVKEIYKELTQDDLKRCRLAFYHSGILFSHAGVSKKLFSFLQKRGYEIPSSRTGEAIFEWIEKLQPHIYDLCDKLQTHPLLEAGYARGGYNEVGGLTWEDFGAHLPLPGVAQIVGHTILKQPTFVTHIKNKRTYIHDFRNFNDISQHIQEGWTLDIDNNSRYYVVIENGFLHIKEVIYKDNEFQDNVELAKIKY